MFPRFPTLFLVFLFLHISACRSEQAPNERAEATAPAAPASEPVAPAATDDTVPTAGPTNAYHAPDLQVSVFDEWQGDLPDMVERRVIRALVPWSDTYYYLDGIKQRGIAFEALVEFEKWLNQELGSGTVKMHVVILPVRRDLLLPFVAEGRGDIALGGITVTEERSRLVDFTIPASREVQEWLVESADAPRLAGIDDLSGKEVHVRSSSSYWESLQAINRDFAARGLAAIDLQAADEYLSTEDLLQMVNAGAIPYSVADHEMARYWANVLPDMRVREDLVVRQGANYAWALRHDSPELKAMLDRFITGHRQGTLFGNVLANRYLKDSARLHSIHGEAERKRLQDVFQYFRTHSDAYDFDAVIMVAQGFQESRLDQSMRSHRGALGIMQLLPTTAADPAVGVPDISTAENNILAGIRYMAWIRDTYFDDPALDDFNKTALAFASYNAGPNRVARLRDKAAARGLDPNLWFENVELVAAEDIGRETVEYVANIYKYYIAFKLAEQRQATARNQN